jgi:hypothetical protein
LEARKGLRNFRHMIQDNEINIFYRRMEKIGIKLQLVGNYPWIYLDSVNGNKVKREDFVNANHGFTIGWSGINNDDKPRLIEERDLIFKMIRKYR